MIEDCPAIEFLRQENRDDELPVVPKRAHPSVKAQRDHRKKNPAHALLQAVSVRRMRPSVLSLVNQRKSELIRCGNDNRYSPQPIQRMIFTKSQHVLGSAIYSTTRTVQDCGTWDASLCDPPIMGVCGIFGHAEQERSLKAELRKDSPERDSY